jgi:hypothetical protein
MDQDRDLATFITAALGEVCFGGERTHPHVRTLRSLVGEGRIEVLEALRVGERIADRHRVSLTKSDGSTSQIEVYLFGTLDPDGRLRRVDEVTRVVIGGAEDAALARAR